MSTSRSRKALGLALSQVALISCLNGCGGEGHPAKNAHATSVTADFGVESYLPLLDSSVLAFETEQEGTAERGLLVMQVRRPRPNLAEVKIGQKVHRLDLVKDGVRVAEGGYVLKAPIEVGATFTGQYGSVKITHVNKQVTVPAGRFEGCVETEETTGTSRTTTSYCPTIGITLLEVESLSVDAPGREIARLKSHGPLMELGEDQVKVTQ